MQPVSRKIATAAVLALSFLLPLKFGSLVLPQHAGMFHDGMLGWLLNSWPGSIFFVAAPVSCVLALYAFPARRKWTDSAIFALLFLLLWLVSWLGTVNASQYFYSAADLLYLGAVCCYIFAVKAYLQSGEPARRRLIAAWSLGIALAVATGLYQYFFGFDQLMEFIAEQRKNGVMISTVLEAKIADRRTYTPFDLSNSLAGFLLAATPLLAAGVWRFCGKFDPPGLTRAIFLPVTIGAALLVLATTRSRAGLLAAAVAIAAAGIFKLRNPVLKLAATLCLMAALAGGAVYVKNSGRGFGSLASRADYAKVAIGMIAEHPFAGAGWGEFFYDYMQNKTDGTEEAPHSPHNILLAFGSQAGIFAMFAALAFFAFPFVHIVRHRQYDAETVLFAAGFLGFFLHSLADVNLLAPSSMALAGTLGLLITGKSDAPADGKPARLAALLPALLAAPAIWFAVADYYFNAGERSYPAASRAAELMPWNPHPQLQMAALRPSETVERLDRAIAIAPRDPDFQLRKMEYYYRSGRLKQAEKCLEEARGRFPDNWLLKGSVPQVLSNLARSRNLE